MTWLNATPNHKRKDGLSPYGAIMRVEWKKKEKTSPGKPSPNPFANRHRGLEYCGYRRPRKSRKLTISKDRVGDYVKKRLTVYVDNIAYPDIDVYGQIIKRDRRGGFVVLFRNKMKLRYKLKELTLVEEAPPKNVIGVHSVSGQMVLMDDDTSTLR